MTVYQDNKTSNYIFIRLYLKSSSKPLFMFDLDSHVTDIAWAPYSSTVFAASTLDGRVHVFDLKLDKYHAICSQKVTITKHTGLNHLSFNLQYPVLNVGDTK